MGYLFYGGVSFGLTEFLKRRFVELAGPDLSALYPIPILLGARYAMSGGGGATCVPAPLGHLKRQQKKSAQAQAAADILRPCRTLSP